LTGASGTREIFLNRNTPLRLTLMSSAGGPLNADFAVYAWTVGDPDGTMVRLFPATLAGWCARPPFIAGGFTRTVTDLRHCGIREPVRRPHRPDEASPKGAGQFVEPAERICRALPARGPVTVRSKESSRMRRFQQHGIERRQHDDSERSSDRRSLDAGPKDGAAGRYPHLLVTVVPVPRSDTSRLIPKRCARRRPSPETTARRVAIAHRFCDVSEPRTFVATTTTTPRRPLRHEIPRAASPAPA